MRRARAAAATCATIGCAGAIACSAVLGIGDRSLDTTAGDAAEAASDDAAVEAEASPSDSNAPDTTPIDGGSDAGADVDAGPCGDTQTNGKNCGRCKHDCLGGDCVGGVCQPVELVQTKDNRRPWHLAQDAAYLYWTDTINSLVARTDKTSGVTTTYWANGTFDEAVAVDDASVYFSDLNNVYRCPLLGCGGGPTAFLPPDSGLEAHFLVADDRGVYFTDYGTPNAIWHLPKAGGPATTIFTALDDAGLEKLVGDGQYLYVASDNGTIVQVPDDGGAPRVLNADAAPPSAFEVATDSTRAYWTQQDPNFKPSAIYEVDKSGADAQAIASNQVMPMGIAVDSTSVYWSIIGSTINFQGGAVLTCALASCGTPTTLASKQIIPTEVVVDDTAVYWVVHGNGNNEGAIRKVAKP